MSIPRRGLLAAGLTAAVAASLGVFSTMSAGAEEAPAAPEPATKPVPEKTTIGKAAIAKNPDGTLNSASAKPVTAESTVSAGGLGPYRIGATLKSLQAAGLVGKTAKLRGATVIDDSDRLAASAAALLR